MGYSFLYTLTTILTFDLSRLANVHACLQIRLSVTLLTGFQILLMKPMFSCLLVVQPCNATFAFSPSYPLIFFFCSPRCTLPKLAGLRSVYIFQNIIIFILIFLSRHHQIQLPCRMVEVLMPRYLICRFSSTLCVQSQFKWRWILLLLRFVWLSFIEASRLIYHFIIIVHWWDVEGPCFRVERVVYISHLFYRSTDLEVLKDTGVSSTTSAFWFNFMSLFFSTIWSLSYTSRISHSPNCLAPWGIDKQTT